MPGAGSRAVYLVETGINRRHGEVPARPPGFFHRGEEGWEAGPPAGAPAMTDLKPYAWHLLPRRYWRTYFQGFRSTGMSQTSEGCPYDCSFCSVWQVHGRKVNVAALANVQHDFRSLPPSMRGFFFADDIWMQATEPQRRELYDPLLRWLADDFLSRRPDVWMTVETRTDLFLRQEARFADWIRHGNLKRIFFGVEAVTIATPLPGTELYQEVLAENPELADRNVVRHPAFSLFCALTPTRLPLAEFYRQVARLYRVANRVRFRWDLSCRQPGPVPLGHGRARPPGRGPRSRRAEEAHPGAAARPSAGRAGNLDGGSPGGAGGPSPLAPAARDQGRDSPGAGSRARRTSAFGSAS